MTFDLDAVIAEATKADRRKKFSFKFDGEEYTLPNQVDQLALAATSTGQNAAALKRLMPPADFARISDSGKVLTADALRELLNAYYQHLVGLELGESVASTRSSSSTARPSNRTSKSTTKRR